MDNKLHCCRCLHTDEMTDRVTYRFVPQEGKEMALCVDQDNCAQRQLNAHRIDRDKKTLATTR